MLESGGLKNKPRQLYNCDESFLPLDHSREKVVASKGSKVVYSQSMGTSEHISLLCCVSAARFPLSPMINYAKSFPGGQYRFDGLEDSLYAKSDSGWIDSELFLAWLKKIFVTPYEKIDHMQNLLNSRYRLTKSGYGEIFFYQLFIPTGIGINNLSSIAIPNFSPLTPP